MRVGYVEDEALNYLGWGAEESDGAVGGGVCGVFVGFADCDDCAVFPGVWDSVVGITIVCYVGECLYVTLAKVFEVNVADVVWPTGT